MTALIVIVAVIALLALLRAGVYAEFGGGGLRVIARVGFVSVRILPAKPMKEKKKKEEKPRKKKEKKPEPEEEVKKPGKVTDFKALISAGLKSLGRLRRRLLIKRLVVHYIAAGDDAYKTAMSFGTVNAAMALLTPLLESRLFRIRRRDFKASADFEAAEPYIYAEADISLAVWETIYIAICLLPPLLKRKTKKSASRKENEDYGQTSDRRADGNHDAKNPGNGGR